MKFDGSKFGVVFRVSHGVSLKLVGDVNVFALYSILNGKIWIFAVKHLRDDEVKLMKCAVIDCSLPVFSISLSFGFLILGENNGVRVLLLRPLVKGRVIKKEKKSLNGGLEKDKMEIKKVSLRNGMINGINAEICSADGNKFTTELKFPSNSVLEERIENRTGSGAEILYCLLSFCSYLRSLGWGLLTVLMVIAFKLLFCISGDMDCLSLDTGTCIYYVTQVFTLFSPAYLCIKLGKIIVFLRVISSLKLVYVLYVKAIL